MYIGPIQQTNTNSLNRINFKQVTVDYRDIDDKEWKAIDRKVNRAVKPIMYKLEKLSEGHDVLLNVSYISSPPIRLGETFEPFKEVVEIIIDNDWETAKNVLIKQYQTDTVFPKEGGWDLIKTDIYNVPVKTLRENILNTLQSMLKAHK